MQTSDNAQMARFKTHIRQLMLKKSVDLGYPLTQQEVAEKTGLSVPAVSRWYNSTVNRLEADTMLKLARFFGCDTSELYEVIEDD